MWVIKTFFHNFCFVLLLTLCKYHVQRTNRTQKMQYCVGVNRTPVEYCWRKKAFTHVGCLWLRRFSPVAMNGKGHNKRATAIKNNIIILTKVCSSWKRSVHYATIVNIAGFCATRCKQFVTLIHWSSIFAAKIKINLFIRSSNSTRSITRLLPYLPSGNRNGHALRSVRARVTARASVAAGVLCRYTVNSAKCIL